MQYLIIPQEGEPFFTEHYSYENIYTEGMKVFDFAKVVYTTDGKEWKDFEFDHL